MGGLLEKLLQTKRNMAAFDAAHQLVSRLDYQLVVTPSGAFFKIVRQLIGMTLIGLPMHSWPVQDAKARFSEFLSACLTQGPQMVTKRGTDTAVLVPLREWQRLQAVGQPSVKQLLLQDDARTQDLGAVRGQAKRRKSVPLS